MQTQAFSVELELELEHARHESLRLVGSEEPTSPQVSTLRLHQMASLMGLIRVEHTCLARVYETRVFTWLMAVNPHLHRCQCCGYIRWRA